MKIVQCLFFFIAPLFAFSQTEELHLPLTFHDGNGPFEYALPVMKWNDTSALFKKTYQEVKGIPSEITNIRKGRIYFDFGQYYYQNFIAGNISKEDFAKIRNNGSIKFNEKVLVKNPIKCFVNVITATNEKNEKVCIIDVNNNYDFSDDTIFIPLNDSLPDEQLNKHLIKVLCERVLNGRVITDQAPLLLVKGETLLEFSIAQYATTTVKIENKDYQLAVCPLYFTTRTWNQTQLVLLDDSLKTKKASQDLIVDNGGFISVGHHKYKFIGVDFTENSLALQKVGNENKYFSQVGFMAPLFKSKNILTGKAISLASYRGKYIFIDFWGTWCGPCRQQLPELVIINNSVDSSQFIMISIASSDVLNTLKKVIIKEKMVWPQLLSDKITKQYNVGSFPTSLLIDPNGIVIEKDLSMNDLREKLSKLKLLKGK
ncbi:MAG: TlpA disulfide reductase family protein [Ferruginibacter sp.]